MSGSVSAVCGCVCGVWVAPLKALRLLRWRLRRLAAEVLAGRRPIVCDLRRDQVVCPAGSCHVCWHAPWLLRPLLCFWLVASHCNSHLH